MYAKGKFYAKYFKVDKEPTEKTVFGRISESIKIGEENGHNVYEFENWYAYFVGKAYEKAKTLNNQTDIIVTEWITRNQPKKEGEGTFPHIRIVDFELAPQKEN